MKVMFKYLSFVILLVYSIPNLGNDVLNQGLYFCSFEVDKDKRTCLDLTPEHALVFNKGFSMKFDVKLRREYQNFGYIFRIICNDTVNVDLLADLTSSIANFSLVIKNKTVIQYQNQEITDTIENVWIKVLFVFDPLVNKISLSLNGISKEVVGSLVDLKRFNFYFGGNMHRDFSTTDIAPMTVKDIRIFEEKDKLVRNWELAKHSSNNVYDNCILDKATVQNPIWEIDRHVKWKKRQTVIIEGEHHHIAFDRASERFFFTRNNAIFVYDIKRNEIDTFKILAGVPFSNDRSNQIIYDPNRHVLLSYNFEQNAIATFDFATCRWNNDDDSMERQQHSHHSRLFIAEDSLLVTFGGYGYHRYNSMFYKCWVNNNQWESIDMSQFIPPRYLGGMGRLDDERLLYFGGFGNISGLQGEAPRNFYDLYSINIDSASVKKIWELSNPPGEHFTNSNSLVIDKNNGKFYALAYPNKRYASIIKLHEYNLNKAEYRIVGDSIPYFFNDIESFCDLFQSADGSELYALTSYLKNNSSEINIYSIAFPPLHPNEIVQQLPSRVHVWLLMTLLAVATVAIVFIIYRYLKRKNKDTAANTETTTSTTNLSTIDQIEKDEEEQEEQIVNNNLFEELKPSSINLLGNFQVVDSNKNDITHNFTPTTTQLFMLLLMSTIKNGKGITSPELDKILWHDKDNERARNNRNVYVSKLRGILKPFLEIKLTNNNGYWALQYDKNVFCDYEKAIIMIKTLKTGENFNIKLLTKLVDIALKGTFLPHIQQTEWLEAYQTDYTDRLIECLMKYSKYDEVKNDFLLLLKIADAILVHDNIDEDAIKIKCYALYKLGRKNQALQAFNKFTTDYESLLATKHNLVFEELLKD